MYYQRTVLMKHDGVLGAYCTNGIVALADSVCLDALVDVACGEECVNRLVRLLNRGNVSLLHFRDVVEDYLGV